MLLDCLVVELQEPAAAHVCVEEGCRLMLKLLCVVAPAVGAHLEGGRRPTAIAIEVVSARPFSPIAVHCPAAIAAAQEAAASPYRVCLYPSDGHSFGGALRARAGYAAYKVSKGEEYRYPFIADLVESP